MEAEPYGQDKQCCQQGRVIQSVLHNQLRLRAIQSSPHSRQLWPQLSLACADNVDADLPPGHDDAEVGGAQAQLVQEPEECTAEFTSADKPLAARAKKRTGQQKFLDGTDGLIPAVAIKKFKEVLHKDRKEIQEPETTLGVMSGSHWTVKKHTRLVMKKLVIGPCHPDFWEAVQKHFGPNDKIRALVLAKADHIDFEDVANLVCLTC